MRRTALALVAVLGLVAPSLATAGTFTITTTPEQDVVLQKLIQGPMRRAHRGRELTAAEVLSNVVTSYLEQQRREQEEDDVRRQIDRTRKR